MKTWTRGPSFPSSLFALRLALPDFYHLPLPDRSGDLAFRASDSGLHTCFLCACARSPARFGCGAACSFEGEHNLGAVSFLRCHSEEPRLQGTLRGLSMWAGRGQKRRVLLHAISKPSTLKDGEVGVTGRLEKRCSGTVGCTSLRLGPGVRVLARETVVGEAAMVLQL